MNDQKQDFQMYVAEQCAECLIVNNCIIYDNINEIQQLLTFSESESLFDKLGDCKIMAAIKKGLDIYIKVGKR